MSPPSASASARRRIVAGAALAAVALAAAGTRLETVRLAGSPFLSAPDSVGFRRGPVVTLGAGERHRCRMTVARADATRLPAAADAAWCGFVPEDRPGDRDALALRRFDFGRGAERTYQFTFRTRATQRRSAVWREMAPDPGLRLTRVELATERRLWDPAAHARPRGGGFAGFVARLAAALAACAAAGAGAAAWARRARGGVPPAPAATAAPGRATAAGLAAYALAGAAVWCLDAAVARSPDASGVGAFWVLLPGRGGWAGAGGTGPTLLGLALWPLAGAAAAAAGWTALVRRRAWLAWTLPVALLGAAFAVATLGPRSDFKVYDTAGLALWAGVDPYALAPERVLNPPPFVLACGLLPWLPLGVAAFAWFGLKAAVAAWCVPLARAGLTPRPGPPGAGAPAGRWWARPEWLALWVAGRFVAMDLQYGNTNVLVLGALLAVAAAWAAGRGRAGGGAAVAGIALKATPVWAPLAALLAGRARWAVAALAVAAALTLGSAAALERLAPGAGWGFAREAAPRPEDLSLGRADNQSLRGLADRHVGGAEVRAGAVRAVPTLALGAPAARAVEAALAALVLGAVWVLARRARSAGDAKGPGREAWADLWAGAALALLLTSPGSWTVHFALLYLPLVVLVGRARRGGRAAAAAVLLIAAAGVPPAFSRALGEVALAYSWLTWAALGGLAALLVGRPAGGLRPPARPAGAAVR